MSKNELVEKIDELLPQTQCTKCGYKGCFPYAEAIASGHAKINLCSPGGDSTVVKLSKLLKTEAIPLDISCGKTKPLHVAIIDEESCIGCTLCLKVCPVDAIVGTKKKMHSVFTDQCTGCELCISPCPVDCISMVPAERAWGKEDADNARKRHNARLARFQDKPFKNVASEYFHASPMQKTATRSDQVQQKSKFIQSILEKAKSRRLHRT